ncbi:MAG: sigma-54 dependent transcriptional regulator [Candidatus Sumerlaeota bacterium]|nr:sigma-54 dependent transcriptional regulator [Candidatus Sumerlaeota bacterium]
MRALILDDDAIAREQTANTLRAVGVQVVGSDSGQAVLAAAASAAFAVAVVETALPGELGWDIIHRLQRISPDTAVIIYTSQPSMESCIRAIRKRIFDYFKKPEDLQLLAAAVLEAMKTDRRAAAEQINPRTASARSGARPMPRSSGERPSPSPALLIGRSPSIEGVRQAIALVAPTNMTVFLRGESGTGKDVAARLIHEISGRAPNGPLVKVNCPAVPEALLESEMFGHEAGAFTGADREKPGRFEIGDGGTVFLDEIGEMPPGLQVKLLQVIEHKRFTRLGAKKSTQVDVRIIAATNAPLESMLETGRFRRDLFYRLNEFSIELPPLRQRPEDIPLLAAHFLSRYAADFGHPDLLLSKPVLERLRQDAWPGNVRELEAVIRRYALSAREDSILNGLDRPRAGESQTLAAPSSSVDAFRQSEMALITAALIDARWNRRKAAKSLGVTYSALRYRLDKYDITPPGPDGSAPPPLWFSPHASEVL